MQYAEVELNQNHHDHDIPLTQSNNNVVMNPPKPASNVYPVGKGLNLGFAPSFKGRPESICNFKYLA